MASPEHDQPLSPAEEAEERREDSITAARSGRASPSQSSQGLMRIGLKRGKAHEKRAMKIRFFRNGDKFFKGLLYALSLERIRSFDVLIEDLTRVLVDKVNLPKGVRFIFSVDGKEKILTLEQLNDGDSYVCSSNDHFVKLDYLNIEKPHWIATKKLTDSQSLKWETDGASRESRDFIKPKIITIIRNGNRPRKVVRLLLNKKTAHSFDQVLNDITNAIKLDTGAVRKVFNRTGQQVMSLADFFTGEEIFIAYGSEKCSHEDFIIESEELKYVKQGVKLFSAKYKRVSESPSSRRKVSVPYALNLSPYDSSKSSFSSPLFPSSCLIPRQRRLECQNGHRSPIPLEITQKYDLGRIIGDGNFAVVHKCVNKVSKAEYALKIIDKNKCRCKEHFVRSEVAILKRVKHVNIVQLIEEYDFENDLYLVMELVKGGDLFDAIADAGKYTEEDARMMVHDLSSALCYLHSLNIVHRDIKPENLLVVEHENGNTSLKLGDFGLAVEVIDPLFTVCGTPTYVAPEILNETGYGLKVDVWAAGVITYILLCGFPPFVSQSCDQEELFDQILSGKYEFTSPFWDDISDSAKELIIMMLQVEPNNRYSATEVLEHPWVDEASIAHENELTNGVSREITVHFGHKAKPSLKTATAGIALITITSGQEEQFLRSSHFCNKNIVKNYKFRR